MPAETAPSLRALITPSGRRPPTMGKVAGANAAGDSLVYENVPAALNFHGFNTALFAAGDNGKNPNLVYKTVRI